MLTFSPQFRNTGLVLSATLLLCFVSGLVAYRAQAQSSITVRYRVPISALESKAIAAQQNDADGVRALVHGVFEPFKWADSDEVRGTIEERVNRAETAHRAGNHPGITEENVVKAVNNLARKLGAPEYAKTDIYQVRYLRTSLMLRVPHLVGANSKGGTMSRRMSPAEATYVTLSLIHQKLFNERFQRTSSDWAREMRQENWDRWKKHRSSEPDSMSQGPRLVSVAADPKLLEMNNSVYNGLRSLPFNQLSTLPDSALDDLGVQK